MIRNGRFDGGGDKIGVLLAVFAFPVLNDGFRAVIDAQLDMRVVGEVDDRDDLGRALETTEAGVVIAECLPSGFGCATFQTIESIHASNPRLRILALECRCSSEQFSLALKAGADGFLTREAAPADVVNAVRCVSAGQTYVSPSLVTKMVNTYVLRTPTESLEDPYLSLTEREREILLLVAQGHTNREIARIFHLSEQTVHNYRATLMEKLGFHDRVDLLKFAIRRGVIDVADL